jgi:hypothetical protein
MRAHTAFPPDARAPRRSGATAIVNSRRRKIVTIAHHNRITAIENHRAPSRSKIIAHRDHARSPSRLQIIAHHNRIIAIATTIAIKTRT